MVGMDPWQQAQGGGQPEAPCSLRAQGREGASGPPPCG